MKTHIKSKMIIFVVLVLMTIATITFTTSPVYCYAEEVKQTQEEEVNTKDSDWSIYFEEKIMPPLISVCAAIVAILAAILPILNIVKKSSEKFKSASKNVEDTLESNQKQAHKVLELEERLYKIEKSTSNTEQITRIAFSNMEELVINGYATEIAKVGKDEEDKTTELES